jgi:hypothetical protein
VEHLGIWMDDYGQPDADGLQEITMNIAYFVELLQKTTRRAGPTQSRF